MNIGDIMEVHYGPDREIRMEYQGNKHFNYKVLQTVNTKFECGDLVHVPLLKKENHWWDGTS